MPHSLKSAVQLKDNYPNEESCRLRKVKITGNIHQYTFDCIGLRSCKNGFLGNA